MTDGYLLDVGPITDEDEAMTTRDQMIRDLESGPCYECDGLLRGPTVLVTRDLDPGDPEVGPQPALVDVEVHVGCLSPAETKRYAPAVADIDRRLSEAATLEAALVVVERRFDGGLAALALPSTLRIAIRALRDPSSEPSVSIRPYTDDDR
jgi:hypothetical protein